MMSKIIPRKSAVCLCDRVRYLEDKSCPSHRDKEVSVVACKDCRSTQHFQQLVLMVEAQLQNRRRGPRITNIAEERIVSTPTNAQLAETERKTIVDAVLQDVPPCTPAVWAWHKDRSTGREDLHVLVVNVIMTSPPRALRNEEISPIAQLRGHMDWVTACINATRLADSRAPLNTMREAKDANIRLKGRIPLTVLLASLRRQGETASVPDLVRRLEWEVKEDADFLWVTPAGNQRTFKYKRSTLEAEVAKELAKLRSMDANFAPSPQSPEPAPQLKSPASPTVRPTPVPQLAPRSVENKQPAEAGFASKPSSLPTPPQPSPQPVDAPTGTVMAPCPTSCPSPTPTATPAPLLQPLLAMPPPNPQKGKIPHDTLLKKKSVVPTQPVPPLPSVKKRPVPSLPKSPALGFDL